MNSQYEIIRELTSPELSGSDQKQRLGNFAEVFGWKPSDYFTASDVSEFATIHLLVEHGLENTAVLSFLRHPYRYADLNTGQKTQLLSLSYNNLVNLHIPIGYDEAVTVYNLADVRNDNGILATHRLSHGNTDHLRSEHFEIIRGKRLNPNLPPLDDALIDTISHWKRRISVEFEQSVPNENLSALFNAIIFARVVEDHQYRYQSQTNGNGSPKPKKLLDFVRNSDHANLPIRAIIKEVATSLISPENIPEYLIDEPMLEVFDALSPETVFSLLSDFYNWRSIPYSYDFSVMSKHALSRIYERYVSVLRTVEVPPTNQIKLFPNPPLPKEEKSKTFGGIYTPQFIARFFAKFLRNQLPTSSFKKAVVSDPACGSGIFLRTLLELRYEDLTILDSDVEIEEGFKNVIGVDIDPNATQATKLSLASLHFALTDKFPKTLNINTSEAIEYVWNNPNIKNSLDAVIANPPFVPVELQPPSIRERILLYMGKDAQGRIDSYLPFIKIALDALKPGGYGLFVLPHSFLLAESATRIREILSESAWIHCLADLSEISVFEGTGAYTLLLIFQKKPLFDIEAPPATIVKCQEFVGRALQSALDQKYEETEFYNVYKVEQRTFQSKKWIILPPDQEIVKNRMDSLPQLEDFFTISQGFVTGADAIFTLLTSQVPVGEEDIFAPYLRDREMQAYVTPQKVTHSVFYPFVGERYISEDELRAKFPKTWDYLLQHQERLKNRASVKRGAFPWWRPEKPVYPSKMMRPKIVSPHLVIVPRFSLDLNGKYAVSHSPIMYPKNEDVEIDSLKFFVAILNSQPCFWYIANNSHVYSKSYSMLEVKTLKKVPVPDLENVPVILKRQVLDLVEERLVTNGLRAIEIENKINEIAADLYQLSRRERKTIGMS